MPKVYHKHRDKGKIPSDAVYIGRPSLWGNPWMMLDESQRDAVCDRFEQYLAMSPELVIQIKMQLKGKDLVCYCAPKRCHGDILLRIANEEDFSLPEPPRGRDLVSGGPEHILLADFVDPLTRRKNLHG